MQPGVRTTQCRKCRASENDPENCDSARRPAPKPACHSIHARNFTPPRLRAKQGSPEPRLLRRDPSLAVGSAGQLFAGGIARIDPGRNGLSGAWGRRLDPAASVGARVRTCRRGDTACAHAGIILSLNCFGRSAARDVVLDAGLGAARAHGTHNRGLRSGGATGREDRNKGHDKCVNWLHSSYHNVFPPAVVVVAFLAGFCSTGTGTAGRG